MPQDWPYLINIGGSITCEIRPRKVNPITVRLLALSWNTVNAWLMFVPITTELYPESTKRRHFTHLFVCIVTKGDNVHVCLPKRESA